MSAPQASTALPDGVRRGNEKLLRLTSRAGTKVSDLLGNEPSGSFLRVGISGGGCNGLSYKLKFVKMAKKGDIMVSSEGVETVVDSRSALYLRGTELDYSDALVGGGFKFSNPNARSSCSCGESFSV